MKRSNLIELSLVESLLNKTCVYFDENKCRAGDAVVYESRKIREEIRVDVMSNKMAVDLKEDEPCARLKHITISDVDEETLVLKPDNFGRQYFRPCTYNKACDYLILTRWNRVRYALFVDLKTKIHEHPDGGLFRYESSDKDKEMAWQMIGADNLLDSLIVTAERQKGNKRFSNGVLADMASSKLMGYRRRYLIFYIGVEPESGSLSSTRTIPVQRPLTTLLEKPIHAFDVINNDKMQIGDLFGRGLEQ